VAHRFRGMAIVIACLAIGGCGSKHEPERFPVTGTVTLDGKRLAEGLIYFKTIAAGSIDSAEIKDGKFQCKAEAGERRVEISAYENGATRAAGNDPMIPKTSQTRGRNLLPPRYNLESQLMAAVTSDGPNQFTFDLKSK
jgi:hypothetical protein